MSTAEKDVEFAVDTTPARRSPIITCEGVWKSYRPKSHQVSLRHEALKLLRPPSGGVRSGTEDVFWALRDVSFDIRPGESVALIGRNGSGKTTLLRILAGITRPTRGGVQVNGRFAALIGLGAGFNFERTGRENIFLNAAIHGVPPQVTTDFLDEIIGFAELADFIDVPVKRYSSGMVTRLAFSISVHIFPDIVLIDEVLAVGDAAFQEKCMARIRRMKTEGRTLLFVSHEPGTVRMVCDRAIWLHHGEMRFDGPTDEALEHYSALVHLQEGETDPGSGRLCP